MDTTHPLRELTVRNGNLFRQRHGSEAAYLDTPPILIEGKNGFSELGRNDVVYYFNLNEAPDRTWCQIFNDFLEGVSASIQSQRLEVRCIPANLEGRYNRVKEMIAKTNDAYAAHKAELTARVIQLDEQRRREDETTASRTKVISDQFNKLKL